MYGANNHRNLPFRVFEIGPYFTAAFAEIFIIIMPDKPVIGCRPALVDFDNRKDAAIAQRWLRIKITGDFTVIVFD